MKKKIFIITVVIVALVVTGLLVFGGSKDTAEGELPRIKVQKGNIVEKALAVGTIEPENEISVKSKVSGVVKRIFADAGTYVKAGQPLLEVRPDPTPIELADAKRQVQLAQVEVNNLEKDMVRQVSMMDKGLISIEGVRGLPAEIRRRRRFALTHREGETGAASRAARSRSTTPRSNRSSRPPSTGSC